MKKLILIGAMVIAGAACAMGSVKAVEGVKAAEESTWYRTTGELEDGKYVILSLHTNTSDKYKGYYYFDASSATVTSGNSVKTEGRSSDGSKLVTSAGDIAWTIEKNGEHFNISRIKDDKTTYIGKTDGTSLAVNYSYTSPIDVDITPVGTGYTITGVGNYSNRYLRVGQGTTSGASTSFLFPTVESVIELYSATRPSEKFAQKFLDAELCDGGVTAPSTSTWQGLSEKFALLNTEEKDILKNATASEGGTVVEQCVARYDYIVAKYGASTYADFMGREPAQATSGALLGSFDNNMTIIIVVSAAAVALFASYIILKKRKASVSR